MQRYICIHGHFYQPPRENPWLEEVEPQDETRPYHDWNDRITEECYRANGSSRILDHDQSIVDIVNNYESMSWNFGPTLLSWMQRRKPRVYRTIAEADRESCARFGGHGPALAQCYNHLIMPLASARDKKTQVSWGIADFAHRFGRSPEGMWLPETAVDLETLEALAAAGIRFTILSPYQAKRIRRAGEDQWRDVPGGSIDITRAYRCALPSGRSISLFFYNGPVSHDISFGNLLEDGRAFADRLAAGFSGRDGGQLVHVATDGETYGHHHRFGNMALAFCLYYIEARDLGRVTVYGEFLEKNPPEYEVQIEEDSSWSCPHGVQRWASDCGCRIGRGPGWVQEWREPLRQALDQVRDRLASVYEDMGGDLFKDPWEAREQYIRVVLDRSREQVHGFLDEHALRPLGRNDTVRALRLLEMQRQCMLMYTSCGWFFDEISDIETTQVMKYVSRAMQLSVEVEGPDLEPAFLAQLEQAPSNRPQYANGRRVYEELVAPSKIDLLDVGAHYAIESLLRRDHEQGRIYCFTVQPLEYRPAESGAFKLAAGRAGITSDITWYSSEISFAFLHLGDHHISGGIRENMEPGRYEQMHTLVRDVFLRGDIPEVIRLLDRFFGPNSYSLKNLFKEEQRRILSEILDPRVRELESSLIHEYERFYPLMQTLRSMQAPVPGVLEQTAGLALNARVRDLLEQGGETARQPGGPALDREYVRQLSELVGEVSDPGVNIDPVPVRLAAEYLAAGLLGRLYEYPDRNDLEIANELLEVLVKLPVQIDLGQSQDIYFRLCNWFRERFPAEGGRQTPEAESWTEGLLRLGRILNVKCL
jgi:alpha-amylase/alpha-mannosidase (GH57 family)